MSRRSILICFVISLLMLLLLRLPLSAQTTAPPPNPSPEVLALLNEAGQAEKVYSWQKALHLYEQALALSKAPKDRHGEAVTLYKIGLVYLNIGQPQKALEYYEQALPLFKFTGDKHGEANTLNNIGLVYSHI